MNLSRDREAVKRAVVIIENLIEVAEKNKETEIAEQLREARQLLQNVIENKTLNILSAQNAAALFRYILAVLTSLS
jgi:hypothetical protein